MRLYEDLIVDRDTYHSRVTTLNSYYNTYHQPNRDKDINKIKTFLTGAHTNGFSFDKINYEELLWWEQIYSADSEIPDLIRQLKTLIVNNYIQKQQIMNRVICNTNEDIRENMIRSEEVHIPNSRLRTYFQHENQGESHFKTVNGEKQGKTKADISSIKTEGENK